LCFSTHHLATPTAFWPGPPGLLRAGAPVGTPALGLHSRSARIRTVHLSKSPRALQRPGPKTGHYTKPVGPVNGPVGFFYFWGPGGMKGAGTGGCLAALAASVHRIVYIGGGRPSTPIFPTPTKNTPGTATCHGRSCPAVCNPPRPSFSCTLAAGAYSRQPRQSRAGAGTPYEAFRVRRAARRGAAPAAHKTGDA
jgi:hypothetical protein